MSPLIPAWLNRRWNRVLRDHHLHAARLLLFGIIIIILWSQYSRGTAANTHRKHESRADDICLEKLSHTSVETIPDVETWQVVDIDNARAILDPRLTREQVVSMEKSNWEVPVTASHGRDNAPMFDNIFGNDTITQDNPNLIDLLRRFVIFPPSKLPYNLTKADVLDQSEFDATSTFIWPLIKELEVSHSA
jgi:hypothetical protein